MLLVASVSEDIIDFCEKFVKNIFATKHCNSRKNMTIFCTANLAEVVDKKTAFHHKFLWHFQSSHVIICFESFEISLIYF